MPHWKRTIPFQVDIAGVIHIMGSALYSRPEAAVRELIQNAHDAIMRRRRRELNYQGRVDIVQDPTNKQVEFHDDGFGLSAEEAECYLGTLGIGLTGLLKGEHPSGNEKTGNGDDLIGMFGIGLFSAFMLADRLTVESRQIGSEEAIRWTAGEGTEIELSSLERDDPGTTVRLHLKPDYHWLAEDSERLEAIIEEYADFLPVPIHLNRASARTNVIQAAWFDPTPDRDRIELELAAYFDETPLDVIPVRISQPTSVVGALYVSPRRTPGFSGDTVVTATVRRMVISRRIQHLVPNWASFLRGVLELHEGSPTASREDLVHDATFHRACRALEEYLAAYFEELAECDPSRFQAILTWHRYWWAGAALDEPRLRALLRRTYLFPTSHGKMTFEKILERSGADPLFETEYDRVIWYNTDRRQEAWIDALFTNHPAPCVHTLRTFEESLLAAMVGDAGDRDATDLRFATPSARGFARELLGVTDLEPVSEPWQTFLGASQASIQCGILRCQQPVMAFLNEQHELLKTFEDLRSRGTVPSGFQRLIDAHFDQHQSARNEVLLNRGHRLVQRALEQGTTSPLANVLRLLVMQALEMAGASLPRDAQQLQMEDLDWVAECLWGRE